MVSALAVMTLTALGGLGVGATRRAPARPPTTPLHPGPVWAAPAWAAPLLRETGLHPDTAWPLLVVSAAAGVVVLGALGGPLLAAVGAGALAGAPLVVRPGLQRRVDRRRDEQLPPALDRLAAELRSGRTLGPALIAVAEHAAPPLGTELRALASGLQHGASVTTVLQRWAQGPRASAEVHLAASALALGSEAGGELARSVDDVAATLRERRELRAEARALATQARASAAVLVLAPPAFTLLVSTVEPGTLRFLLGSAPGLACLVGGVALDLIGARWMARIVAAAG